MKSKKNIVSLLTCLLLTSCAVEASSSSESIDTQSGSDVTIDTSQSSVDISTSATVSSESSIYVDMHTYYTVTFDSLGGSEVLSQTVMEDNPVVRPENPSLDNHYFTGWHDATPVSDDNLWDFSVDRVTSDLTLYASWEPISEDEVTTLSLTYQHTTNGYVVTGVGEEERVVIPSTYQGENVIAINDSAFARKDITYVSIPDSITSIGLSAFNNASRLQEVKISPNSQLTSIGNNAFSGNTSLRSIFIPALVQQLGDSVLNNASSLQTIQVDSANQYYYSTGNNLIETSSQTLLRGSNTSTIPEGVRVIGTAAFRKSSISTITIPSTVEEIGRYAFDDCESLTSIEVDDANTHYSSATGLLYNKQQTELIFAPEGVSGVVSIPNTIESIPSNAFDGRSNISVINMPSSVTSFASFSFRGVTARIYYSGDESAWAEIKKHSTSSVESLTIVYESVYDGEEIIDIYTVYFSATGNTENIANMIASYTSSSIYEIIPAIPYTSEDLNYSNSDCRANNEQNEPTSRPEIGSEDIDFSNYEVIYLGYPIWWGRAPKIIYTFLEKHDLSGKVIIPFATSGSSSISGSEAELHALQPNATWLTGHRFSSSSSQTTINSWVDSLTY